MLVHGLEGSSHSQYVIGNANKIFCRRLQRGAHEHGANCGGTDALSPTLYHSGMSGDVKAVLEWLIRRGCRCIVLAGLQYGRQPGAEGRGVNLEAKHLQRLIGVAAVSPPMDLGESADALHGWTNRLYERRFLRNLLARYIAQGTAVPRSVRRGEDGASPLDSRL